MDQISAELSTVGVESAVIGGASSVAGELGIRQPAQDKMRFKVPAGLRDILPGLGSESREELRERDMVNVEDEERMSPERHLKGSRTLECLPGTITVEWQYCMFWQLNLS
jgi:hypothetical protein